MLPRVIEFRAEVKHESAEHITHAGVGPPNPDLHLRYLLDRLSLTPPIGWFWFRAMDHGLGTRGRLHCYDVQLTGAHQAEHQVKTYSGEPSGPESKDPGDL